MDYKIKRRMIKSLLKEINRTPFIDRTIRLFAPNKTASDEFKHDFPGIDVVVAPWRFK